MKNVSSVNKHSLFLAVFLVAGYSALQNGLWIPASDSDLYLSMARNIITGRGMSFNNLPVLKVPPGWPFVLSGLMQISGSFRFLNLFPMMMMIGFILVWHRILVRLTDPATALASSLATGLLFAFFRFSFLLYSDALFLLIFATTVLLALQDPSKKPEAWRILLVVLLACTLLMFRWAALLCYPVLAGAILSGQKRIHCNKRWITAFGLGVLMLCAYAGVKFLMRNLTADLDISAYSGMEATLSKPASISVFRSLQTHARLFFRSGNWIGWLLCPPLELGHSYRPFGVLVNLLGWSGIALYIVNLHRIAKAERWVWMGALLYLFAIASIWWRPNVRYLLPVTPMLIAGIWGGLWSVVQALKPSWLRRFLQSCAWAAVLTVVTVNLFLYAMSVKVARQQDFYGHYHAGQCKDLINIAHWIRTHTPPREKILISSGYENINRSRQNTFGLRALSFLTDRTIRITPGLPANPQQDSREIAAWMRARNITYYVYRPPVLPWRVWHFRAPGIQRWMTGKSASVTNNFFELYQLGEDEKLERVEVPEDAPLKTNTLRYNTL